MLSDTVQSILVGQAALYVVLAMALLFSATRPLTGDVDAMRRLSASLLIGVACQCLHFLEEFVTGFHRELPATFGLVPWSAEFFVAFNVIWIALWVLAAAGIQKRVRIALFPAWFFALGMAGNAVWHPLLSLRSGAYFPGLFTSPVVGLAGAIVLKQLWRVTSTDGAGA